MPLYTVHPLPLPGVLLNRLEQLAQAKLEPLGDADDHVQRRVAGPPLQGPHVGPVHMNRVGEALLGVACLRSQRSHRSAEPGVEGCHTVEACDIPAYCTTDYRVALYRVARGTAERAGAQVAPSGGP